MSNVSYQAYVAGKSVTPNLPSLEETQRAALSHVTPEKPTLRIESFAGPSPSRIWHYDYRAEQWIEVSSAESRPTFYQGCPLCRANAEFVFVDAANRKDFQCPNCLRYQISWRAEALLAENSDNRRAGLADSAKQAPAGKALVIRMPSSQQEHASGVDLIVEYVGISDLPR